MKQYIDKAAIVAEIERRKHKLLDHIMFERDKEWAIRTAHQLNGIIWFLDTFEVEWVDFEMEFDNYTKDILARDVIDEPFTNLYACAKYFFELGLKAQKGGEE